MERDTLAEVSFGEWLRRRRKAAGWTQEQLALQISCSTSALKKIEAEERRPSAQIVERLAEIFNIPTAERTSFMRFARGDWTSALRAVIEDAPWHVSTPPPRSNLPAALTSLIGRERELARLCEYLSDPGTRLVTLIGPPGIGKTRLSVEVARETLSDFPDGVFFVVLAPLEEPALVALTVLQILDFVETTNKSAIERLKDGIGDKQILIVLDNVEHLIEGTATFVSDLLSACPHLKILTTSREALRVPGEWLYPIPVLGIPTTTQLQSIDAEMAPQFAALTLFAERARALRPDFALNADNIEAVANICTQLDGLPLAIELIAARIRLMSPQALLERLSSQFTLYADGMRAVSARQKTLHNAIAWSYDLLSGEEQKLFAHLSVFVGGFTLDAAESVFSRTSTTKTVPDLIALLLDKSLLQRTLDREARGEPRFTMLVTIQQFARDHLRRIGDETEIQNWYLAHFLDFAEQANREMHRLDQFKWLDRLEVEHDNLRAAWDYAIESDAELALRLASALLDFWSMRGNLSEGRRWSAQLLERTDQWGQSAKRAQVLGVAGWLAYHQYDLASARQLLEEALSIARRSGDEKEIALALYRLGAAAIRQHDYQTAQSFTEEYLPIYQELQDQWGIAWGMHDLACFAAAQGHYSEAKERLLKSLAKFEELGDRFIAAYVLNGLGELSRLQDDYEQARKHYEESLEILQELRSRSTLATPICNLAWMSLHRGDYRKAKGLFGESLELSDQYGNKYVTALSLAGFAGVLGVTGKPKQAGRLFGGVESLLEGLGMTGRMDLSDQKEFDHYVAAVRAQLDEAEFTKAWAEGHALTMEQAIAYALENSR
jgi:predicted ATPase/transcriptional regulator with XRE-family HTH domain